MNRNRIIRVAVTALTLALAAALCAAVVALYVRGLALRRETGSATAPIFTREAAAAALGRLAPLGLAWLAAVVAAIAAGALAPLRGRPVRTGAIAPIPPGGNRPGRRAALRGALYALAVLLLALGVFNGGLNDVLVKAINICTECIGLG